MSTTPPEPPRPSVPLPPPPPPPAGAPPSYPTGAPPPSMFGAPPPTGAWQPPASPQQKRPLDPFAVAAFVCGVLPLIPFAFVLGIVGIVRTRRGARRGRVFAILGVVLSVLWTAGTIALVAFVIDSTFADRDSSGRVVEAGKVTLDDLTAGDCLKEFTEGEAFLVADVLPCTEPHAAEVFATFELPDGPYPGTDKAANTSEQGCGDRIPDKMRQPLDDGTLGIAYYYPQPDGWERGDHQVLCLVTGERGPLTESYTP